MLTIADRVTLFELIDNVYPAPFPGITPPDATALRHTVQRMAVKADTAEVPVPRPATAHVNAAPHPVPDNLRDQFLTTGIVNANQPGYREGAGADPFALGAL